MANNSLQPTFAAIGGWRTLKIVIAANAAELKRAGLIEHFVPEDTEKIVQAHFDMAKSSGLVLMSFPTPKSCIGPFAASSKRQENSLLCLKGPLAPLKLCLS